MTSEKKNILVIDDDQAIVRLVKDVLSEAGYLVTTAADGEEGLIILKTAPPDLIILDINMPKLNGLAFYHQVNFNGEKAPKIPIVIFTVRDDLSDLFSDLRVDGYVKKPFKVQHLLDTVKKTLTRRRPKSAKKIIVAESDDKLFNEMTPPFLTAGYQVKRSKFIEDLPYYARDEKPDLILIRLSTLNLMGPEVDVAGGLKRHPATRKIPIIFYLPRDVTVSSGTVASLCGASQAESLFQYETFADLLQEVHRFFENTEASK